MAYRAKRVKRHVSLDPIHIEALERYAEAHYARNFSDAIERVIAEVCDAQIKEVLAELKSGNFSISEEGQKA